MATSPEQRARRRAQRETARQVQQIREFREGRRKTPPEISEVGRAYRNAVIRRDNIGMHVLAQVSPTEVEMVIVTGLTPSQRSAVARHTNYVKAYLDPKTANRSKYAKLLSRYEGRYSGGDPSVEFANDVTAIRERKATVPDDFNFEEIYVKAK